MYKNILSAINEFSNSEVAARYAIALAKSCKAKLILTHIVEKNYDKPLIKRIESSIQRLFFDAQKENIDVESIIETGEPVTKIKEIVKTNDIQLTFIATRKEDIEKRFFSKTLARELVLKLPCSVAMVRVVRLSRGYPKNILTPVNKKITHLEEKTYFILKFAQILDAKITLLHLFKPLTKFFHGEIHLKPDIREKQTSKDIITFYDILKKHHIKVEMKTGYGKISRGITIEAAHRRNDLIIMGASERNLLKNLIGSSPVEDVLKETPCNLIILRPYF